MKQILIRMIGNTKTVTQLLQKITDYDRITNFYAHITENVKPVEDRIKQKFYDLINSLELPDDCLASFTHIIHAMGRSEWWAFKCELNIKIYTILQFLFIILFSK